MDIAPTILNLGGITVQQREGKMLHRGRAVHPITGRSWKSLLSPTADLQAEWTVYPRDRAIGWELHAQAALRKGDYKIVYIKSSYGGRAGKWDDPNGWELFDVVRDPGETRDLSEEMPENLAELLRDWDKYVQSCGVVWGPQANDEGLSLEEAPHLHKDGMELQRTWLQVPHGGNPPL